MESENMRRKMEDEIEHTIGSPIIKNKRFLEDEQLIKSEQLAVLEEIFNTNVRDAEITRLSKHFAPIFRKDHPYHIAIWGKTGTGKTLTLTYFLNLLLRLWGAKRMADT